MSESLYESNPLLSLEQVEVLLPSQLQESQRQRAEALLMMVEQILVARYGSRLSTKWEAVSHIVAGFAASVIARKLAKVNEMAESESAGPFSVRWRAESASGGLFLPNELSVLDSLFGRGGTRTVRTPAPDKIRRLNRMTHLDQSHVVSIAGIPVEVADVYEW